MIRLTEDLKSAKWIYAKGILFALVAVLSGALLIGNAPQIQVALLLAICIWASCRAYYFAFYVIEHYVDPSYRYSGLFDFARYVMRQSQNKRED